MHFSYIGGGALQRLHHLDCLTSLLQPAPSPAPHSPARSRRLHRRPGCGSSLPQPAAPPAPFTSPARGRRLYWRPGRGSPSARGRRPHRCPRAAALHTFTPSAGRRLRRRTSPSAAGAFFTGAPGRTPAAGAFFIGARAARSLRTRTTRRYCTGTLSRQSESTVCQRRTIKLCCDAKQLDQTDLVVAARASFFLVEPFLRFRLDSNIGFYIPHLWVRHQTLHHLLLLGFYGSPAIRL